MTDKESKDESELEESRMSFGDHLEELRTRLGRGIVQTLVGMVVIFFFHRKVMEIVVAPYRSIMLDLNQPAQLKFLGPAHAFFGYLKVSFLVALILTAPLWIYQLWAFVAAGLYKRERHTVYRYAPFCVLLMAAGVAFGYFLLIPLGLRYLLTFGDPAVVQSDVTLSEYLRLFTLLTLVLGLAFQLPLVMVGLTRTGVVAPDTLRRSRRWVILGIFVGAALFTPPDVVTQVLLAIPLLGLFELGLGLSWLSLGPNRPRIDRAVLRSRLIRAGLAVVLIAVVWQPLTEARRSYLADGRVYGDEDERRPPMLGMLSDFEEGEVRFAIRLEQDEAGATFVAALGPRGAGLYRVTQSFRRRLPRNRRSTPEGPALTVQFHPGGLPVFEIMRPDSVRFSAFLPDLLEIATDLSEEAHVEAVHELLEQFTGLKPKGDDPVGAWRQWFEKHREDTWRAR